MLEDAPPRLLPPGRAHARRIWVDDWAHELYPHGEGVRATVLGDSGVATAVSQPDIAKSKPKCSARTPANPQDPPPVGSLPYAPFDWRVIEQILMRDKLLAAGMNVDAIVNEQQLTVEARLEANDAQRAFRSTFVNWFKGTLAPGADFLTWYTRRSEADRTLRVATREEMRAAEVAETMYLETGALPLLSTDAA